MAYPYQKHIWVTKEIIRREYLQNIEDGIYDEQQDRLTQEAALNQAISDEEARAKRAELALTNAVDAETIRATAAENSLSGDISTERTRALSVENDLRTDLTSLSGRVTDESTRALAAEGVLTTNLANEVTRANAAERALSELISTETTRATAAEQTLTTNLSAEISRATAAESSLRDYIDQEVTKVYKPSGSVFFADLPALAQSRLGNVYDIKDAFTTTSDFAEGAGKDYPIGTNVAIELINGTLKYDVLPGFIDTSDFVRNTDYATAQNAGIVKPDGTTTSIDNDGTIHSLGGGQGTAEAAERMIAPIEADATASTRAYAVGRRLILNDTLYKAKTAIAVGDALVIGTNIEASDDVSTQINNANAELQKSYKTNDTASTTINDTDYIPMSENGGTKKKTLWSTIVAKIKSVLGKSDVGLGNVANLDQSKAIKSITRSGTTFTATALDGTTSTFTQQDNNTTYSFATGDSNGQIKVTPSGGSAQNVSVKGLGSAAYTASTAYAAAGPDSAGSSANRVYVPRLNNGAKDYNTDQPNSAELMFVEHGNQASNGPTDDWYFVQTIQSADPNHRSQFAFSMTADANYWRKYNQGTWSDWIKIFDTWNYPDKVKDSGNSTNTTFAYSKAAMAYNDFTYLAGWNGYELRGLNKDLFPPKSHASTGTGYGAGTASNYGHVKVSDLYTSSGGDASQSVAASSAAVNNVYKISQRPLGFVEVTREVVQTNSAYTHDIGGYRIDIGDPDMSWTNYPYGKTILAAIPYGLWRKGDPSFCGTFNKGGWGVVGALNETYVARYLVIYLK